MRRITKRKRSDLKGHSGENQVCKLLLEWWYPVFPGAVFVRTPGSGGWGGASARHARMRETMRASGDIMTTLEEFPFSVEVKWREGWSRDRMLSGRPSPVWGWWKQCQEQATEDALIPMMWFRRSREPWSVFLPANYVKDLPLPPPVVAWTRNELLGVDHGALVPVMFSAVDLVAVSPEVFT